MLNLEYFKHSIIIPGSVKKVLRHHLDVLGNTIYSKYKLTVNLINIKGKYTKIFFFLYFYLKVLQGALEEW